MRSSSGKFLFVFISSLLYFTNLSFSQKTDYKFQQITTKDGLSSNRIWDIYRDSYDFLWICTDVGLDRYDSKNVVKYRHQKEDSTSIGSDVIRNIFEDQKGNLWLGSDKGVNIYNRMTEEFTTFAPIAGDESSLEGSYVDGVIEDHTGQIWVITNGNCLNKWLPNKKHFQRFRFETKVHNYYAPPVDIAALDSEGNIWITSYFRGIYKFNPTTEVFTKYDDPDIDFGYPCYKNIYIDKKNNIWIGTDGNGFYAYNIINNAFTKFSISSNGKGVNKNIILDITSENDRYLLLAVDQGGINRFDTYTHSFEYLMYNSDNNVTGLNNNGIWSFYKDKEDILWVGTSGGGINYYNPKEQKFELYQTNSNNKASLSYNFVGCFYEDHSGNIWVGTDGGGINILDQKSHSFSLLTHMPHKANSLSGNVIRCIIEDKKENIWIATWDSGLNQFNPKSGKFRRYMPQLNDSTSISGNSVWHMAKGPDGHLWLSIYNVGIDIFDIESGVVKRFRTDPTNPNSLSSNAITFIYKDDNNKMWLASENGLNLYNPNTGSFKVYQNFPDNKLHAFLKDSKGRYWVGTSRYGVIEMDLEGNILTVYNNQNGLSHNNIKAITEDNHGNLWVSTNNGLNCINTISGKIKVYKESDGLQGDQFFQQSFMKSKKGKLYFGGYNGFNAFYPEDIKANDFLPPVYITDFKLFNRSVPIGRAESPLQNPISAVDMVELNWKHSVFSFDFVGINYTHPENNQYKYKLDGFEEEWNYTDANRSYTTYTNLDPGKYVFRVAASNNDGTWNPNETKLDIEITPPFWKTTLFKIASVCFLVLLIYLIFYFRTRQLRTMNILLEKKVKHRTLRLDQLISELKTKQDELQSSNEELLATMDKLTEQKKQVDSINSQLEKTHEELKSINEQLDFRVQERTSELVKVNRELDRIVYSASHDLIAPLKSLTGLIYLSKLENTNKSLLDYLSHMEKSVFRLENTIVRLTQLSNNLENDVHKTTATFNNIVDSVIEDLQILFGDEKFNIRKEYAPKAIINTDILRLKIILNNLLSNAIKYKRLHALIHILLEENNDAYIITIKDNGIGIAPNQLDEIFRMFHRASSQSEGSGLGLYITKEIVDRLGGHISVESEQNNFSCFTVVLPK